MARAERLPPDLPPPPAPEEERRLLWRVQQGDQAALEELVQRNQRLVLHWALLFLRKRPETPGVGLDDLVQAGLLGLWEAIRRYQPERGAGEQRLSTYASWWIRQHMARLYTNQAHTIRLPFHIHDWLRRADEPRSPLRDRLLRQARQARAVQSLSQPVHDEDDSLTLEGVAGQEDWTETVARLDRHATIRALLGMLAPREAQVIVLRFGLDDKGERTLEEVGRLLGLSRERVRQIEARALIRLRRLAAGLREGL
mgnify:FL=1